MTWLINGLTQIYGLFVEDGAFSLAICVWLLLVWFVVPHIVTSATVRPYILFAGLIYLLMSSVLRARKLPSSST
jgi:hypothetical protein